MNINVFGKIAKLIGYTGNWRIAFLLGAIGQSLNFFLVTYLTADLTGKIIKAIEAKSTVMLYGAIIGILPLLFGVMLIYSVSKYLSERSCVTAVANIRKQVLNKLLAVSYEKAGEEHSGKKLSYIINDAPVAMEGLSRVLTVPLTAVFMGVGGVIYVVKADISMTLLTLVLAMLTLSYSIFFSRLLRKSSDQSQAALALAGERLKSILDGAVTARIYNMREMLERRYNGAADEAMKAGIRFARYSAVLGGLNNSNHYIGEKFLVFAAGLLLLDGRLDLPALVSVSQMAGGVIGVFQISRILPDIQRSLAGAQRIFDAIENYEEERDGSLEIVPHYSGKAVQLSDVSFSYSDRSKLIKDISFSVEAGEMAAIVGDSGGGKTTLLRLIQGLIMPESGTVEIFGVNTQNARLSSIRKIVSLVPQDVVLFPGTISDNIRIGCENATEQEVIQAATDANIHDFIMEMEKGYQTIVTERGSSLSGGQRQRIAMARAFIRNTPVILLDEATSALDQQSQELFKQSLLQKKGKQTIILVTHNHSLAKAADRIIYV